MWSLVGSKKDEKEEEGGKKSPLRVFRYVPPSPHAPTSIHPPPHSLYKPRWSTDNYYYQLSSAADGIAMGGGGAFALFIDRELMRGSSGECETFFSKPLHLPEEEGKEVGTDKDGGSFDILDLEVWALEADYVGVGGGGGGGGDVAEGLVAEMERKGGGEVEKADRGRGW